MKKKKKKKARKRTGKHSITSTLETKWILERTSTEHSKSSQSLSCSCSSVCKNTSDIELSMSKEPTCVNDVPKLNSIQGRWTATETLTRSSVASKLSTRMFDEENPL